MNKLEVFENEEFGNIRMVEIDGKPYFVGNDIARALEYARPYEAVSTHCKGAVSYRVLTRGGEQEVKIIPEGDVYRLIVKAADQSKNEKIKKKAKRFEAWVFDEVIPTIRQTGSYAMPLPPTPEKAPLTINPGEIARLINTTTRLMERQGATTAKVAENAELICNQYGVKLVNGFVKKGLSDRIDEIEARREKEGRYYHDRRN